MQQLCNEIEQKRVHNHAEWCVSRLILFILQPQADTIMSFVVCLAGDTCFA